MIFSFAAVLALVSTWLLYFAIKLRKENDLVDKISSVVLAACSFIAFGGTIFFITIETFFV